MRMADSVPLRTNPRLTSRSSSKFTKPSDDNRQKYRTLEISKFVYIVIERYQNIAVILQCYNINNIAAIFRIVRDYAIEIIKNRASAKCFLQIRPRVLIDSYIYLSRKNDR